MANEIKRLAQSILAEFKIEILNAIDSKNIVIQARLTQKSANLERYITALEQVKNNESAQSLAQTKTRKISLVRQMKWKMTASICL